MKDRGSREKEPSVEEILGSIKRIIADNEAMNDMSRRRAPRSGPRGGARGEADDILDLDDAMIADADGPAESCVAADGDDYDDGRAAPDDDREESGSLDAILGDEAARSVRHSLEALTAISEPGARPQIVRSGETSLEALVREMLRPMLKDWLDRNLPALVEQSVAREIKRITGQKR